jgi:Tol biopolymer transport system component
MDIFTLNLKTNGVQRLTDTIDAWDEHAQFSPGGKKVAWMSSMGCNCDPSVLRNLQTDVWIMNADGSDQTQVTHLSDSASREFLGGRTVAGDMSWNADGSKLAVYSFDNSRSLLQAAGLQEQIVIIDFGTPQ